MLQLPLSSSMPFWKCAYSSSVSPTFLNRSRIWVSGASEEVTIDPRRTVVQFTDPNSGLTYNAVSYPDATGAETTVGRVESETCGSLR